MHRTRKAALGGVPVARRNRCGFSAEKRVRYRPPEKTTCFLQVVFFNKINPLDL